VKTEGMYVDILLLIVQRLHAVINDIDNRELLVKRNEIQMTVQAIKSYFK